MSEEMEIKPAEEKKTKPKELKKYREALEKLAPEAVKNRRFIPLNGKIPDVPKGDSWKDHLIEWDEAINRLENEKNVGEVFKGDLVGEDIDQVEKAQELFEEKERPDAIQGVSRNGGPHHRWINGGVTGNPEVSDEDDKPIVEYKADWKYLVAPGSYVDPDPDSKGNGLYRTLAIPSELGVLKPEHLPGELGEDQCTGGMRSSDTEFSYQDIISGENWKNLRDHRNRLQGPHPEHGSDTGKNFVIWKDNQTWTCFRHNTGGNIWSLLAVMEGIINCSEAKAGALKGKKWKKTIRAAFDRDLIDSYLAETLTRQADQMAQASQTGESNQSSGEEQESGRKSKLDKLVKIGFDTVDRFIIDTVTDDPFAVIDGGGHQEVHPVKGKLFTQYLMRVFYREEGEGVSEETVKSVAQTLAAEARFGKKTDQGELYIRVGKHEGEIWYDLCEDKWRAVKIIEGSWAVEENPPQIFQRWGHMNEQVKPSEEGNFDVLKPLVNMEGEGDWLLLKGYLGSCLIPDIPHPIPLAVGPQGSTKTTLFKMIRKLIDPSSVEVMGKPKSRDDAIVTLNANYLTLFDNISKLPDWLADILCRASTGEGYMKRELYTNRDQVPFSYNRCVGLNTISGMPTEPDVLDRAFVFQLEHIPQVSREFESVEECKKEGVEEAKRISREWVREWPEETTEYLK